MTKEKQLALIWRHTHRDYRSMTNGEKCILIFRNGTCLVPLASLTDAEITDKLKYALHCEAKRGQS